MEPIYQTHAISFINSTNQQPMIHPEGDYTQLNLKLKRVEHFVDKYQPENPLVVVYYPPVDKNDLSGKMQALNNIMSLRQANDLPTHSFIIPKIGDNQQMSTMMRIKDFNDFTTHASRLNDVLQSITSRLENTYDDHPLHYNKQVEFRQAKYIDNRQAHSFWPVSKAFGDYPLSKPIFDNVIEQLNTTKAPYHICIDFVEDWKEQYSSFDGPPKGYGIEITVFMENTNLPTVYIDLDAPTLALSKEDHNTLDKLLQPGLETLSANIPNWYNSLTNKNKLKL